MLAFQYIIICLIQKSTGLCFSPCSSNPQRIQAILQSSSVHSSFSAALIYFSAVCWLGRWVPSQAAWFLCLTHCVLYLDSLFNCCMLHFFVCRWGSILFFCLSLIPTLLLCSEFRFLLLSDYAVLSLPSNVFNFFLFISSLPSAFNTLTSLSALIDLL